MTEIASEQIETPLRYTNPTRYDIAQYGSLVRVVREDGSHELYVQVSNDLDSSHWITIGELLSRTNVIDHEFIGDALEVYYSEIDKQKKSSLLYP